MFDTHNHSCYENSRVFVYRLSLTAKIPQKTPGEKTKAAVFSMMERENKCINVRRPLGFETLLTTARPRWHVL